MKMPENAIYCQLVDIQTPSFLNLLVDTPLLAQIL